MTVIKLKMSQLRRQDFMGQTIQYSPVYYTLKLQIVSVFYKVLKQYGQLVPLVLHRMVSQECT